MPMPERVTSPRASARASRVACLRRWSRVSSTGSLLLISGGTPLPAALGPWRRPTAVHDPAKILLDLAVSLAVGGDCLADVATLREAPTVFGPVASDPTVSRLIDVLARDAEKALAAIDAARAAARRQ